jgi:drug/metabolite transporter (DMT)-like permease
VPRLLRLVSGLARGGVARVGRLQLAQPALTLGWSALLLGEHVSLLTAAAAAG